MDLYRQNVYQQASLFADHYYVYSASFSQWISIAEILLLFQNINSVLLKVVLDLSFSFETWLRL